MSVCFIFSISSVSCKETKQVVLVVEGREEKASADHIAPLSLNSLRDERVEEY